MKTHLFSLGVSHHDTPLSLRERLSQSPERLLPFLESFQAQAGPADSPRPELVVLSTCNRLELHASALVDGASTFDGRAYLLALLKQLCQSGGIERSEIEPYLFYSEGAGSILHLCRVAAGLDSMLVGEPQILGQVVQAHELALKAGSAGHVLSALFRSAIHAGKRVRTETSISRQSSSVGSACVRLAESAAGPLAGRPILVIGSGEMGRLVVEILHKRGARRVTVTSPTFAHAQSLEVHPGVTAQPYERLGELLAGADVVFAAASAPQPILDRNLVARAMHRRPHAPLLLVDLGVPRNVDRTVQSIPNLRLYDIDDLQSQIDASRARLEKELPQAEAIALAEAQEFEKWLEIIPVISELHKQAESIRRRELDRLRRRMPDLDPRVDASIELLSQSLVKKLLHNPTMRLRKDSGAHIRNYSEALAVLFDLPLDGLEDGGNDLW